MLEPAGSLLVGVSDLQDGALVERLAKNLQTDREAIRKPARDREAGNAGHVCGNRKNVREIHLIWIVRTGADRKSDRWRGGRDDCLDRFERSLEILLDERADLLRFDVIGVVVAATQCVGAQHDAAFDFWPEALSASALVHFAQ